MIQLYQYKEAERRDLSLLNLPKNIRYNNYQSILKGDPNITPRQASTHLSCPGGPAPPSNFFRGGGFSTPGGGLFRSNFNPKNHNFSYDFPVIF